MGEAYRLEMEAQKLRESNSSFNPYARRKVKPQILWEVGQSIREHQIDISGENKLNVRGNSVDNLVSDNVNKVKMCGNELQEKSRVPEHNITKEHHVYRNEEDEVVHSKNNVSYPMFSNNRVRRGISLEEYQKQKISGCL